MIGDRLGQVAGGPVELPFRQPLVDPGEPCLPPLLVGGDDVGTEEVDEPQGPDEQGAEDLFWDAAGAVLASRLSAGIGFAPPVDVNRVEGQPVAEVVPPAPEQPDLRPAGFALCRRTGEQSDKVPLVGKKVCPGQCAQLLTPGLALAVQPGQEAEEFGRRATYSLNLAALFSLRERPRQHRVRQLLGDRPEPDREAVEVQDQVAAAALVDRGLQPPDGVAELRCALQSDAVPQRPAMEDEDVVAGKGDAAGEGGHICSQGSSTRSSRTSVGLTRSACSRSAGLNFARMSWRTAAQAGP